MSPADFYNLTIAEATLIANQYKVRSKENYFLNYIALINALGQVSGGRNFKPQHPFEIGTGQSSPVINKETRDETLAFLRERIEAGE